MSSKIFYVYEILNPLTQTVFYVGITSRTAELRYKEHIRETRTKIVNLEKVNEINNILSANLVPEVKIVFESLTKEEAIARETHLIDLYGRRKDGGILTNISKGGEHHTLSDEIKEQLSKNRKNKTYEELFGDERAKQFKADISIRNAGTNNPMYGKTHTIESRQKMSAKLKGNVSHPVSDYQKQKIKESNSKRVWTDDMRQKLSESQKKRRLERPESFKTHPWTPESRKKQSEARKKNAVKYNFVHPEHGTFYGTTGDLATAYNFSSGSEAYKLVKGLYKSYKGWKLIN